MAISGAGYWLRVRVSEWVILVLGPHLLPRQWREDVKLWRLQLARMHAIGLEARQALTSANLVLKVDPHCEVAWDIKIAALAHLGRHDEAAAAKAAMQSYIPDGG
jgi:hypothetical protein